MMFGLKRVRFVIFFIIVAYSGCAHVDQNDRTDSVDNTRRPAEQIRGSQTVLGEPIANLNLKSVRLDHRWAGKNKLENWTFAGVEIQNREFDLPIENNDRVQKWVHYFSNRGRRTFARYLERGEQFIPYIVQILKENGLPEDLVYLAMIESGFNNHARSRARAVGPWQFISATGRKYGLSVNWWVDERRDTKKSTLAAIRYLTDLYELFGSWNLAASGYNAGEAKILRAIKRFGTRDYWTLIRQRFLRPETRNYVPKMMAAAIIAKNREAFGFEPAKYLNVDELREKVPTNDPRVIGKVNPTQDEYLFHYRALDPTADLPARILSEHLKEISTPKVNKKGEVVGEKLMEFEIEGPADLLKIARASGLSYERVRHLNPHVLRWCTPPHQSRMKINLPAEISEKFLATYNHPSFPRKTPFKPYQVQKGDTLKQIARRFGVRIEPIQDLNGMPGKSTRLRAGQTLLLPLPTDGKRTYSELGLPVPSSDPIKLPKSIKQAKFVKLGYKDRLRARANTGEQ